MLKRQSYARALVIILVAAFTLGACMSADRRRRGIAEPLTEKPLIEKEGQKPLGPVEPIAPAAPASPSEADQLAFINRYGRGNMPFGMAEHEFVSKLPDRPASASVAEAALVIGLVKVVLNPLHQVPSTFEESDPQAPTKPRRLGGVSLETLAKEKNVNISDALSENPLLASHAVARQVYAALAVGESSPGFRSEVIAVLKQRASQWERLVQDLGPEGAAPSPSVAIPVPPGAAVAVNPPGAEGAVPGPVTAPVNPADPAALGGDPTLAEAQQLADRGDYQAAIKKAESLPPASPLYQAAQDKILEFSNLAVQDLRRKAAQAFQNAMPIADMRVRAEYLQQAKNYLEEAIRSYPKATQLPTVRDNLRVISRDLDRLKTTGGG